ncbi:hypothetical protein PSTT_01706, partial [Puccinia striiformis]
MTFCGCIPNPIRLIYYGYVAALPLLPRTAFFIPTLQLYQSLWYESSEPYTSFVSGMMAHQDTCDREKLKACGGRDNSRELRLPFSQALNIFSRIHQWTKEREHYGSRRDNEAEKALELGRLFTLEEDLWNAWSDIPTSREDALSCLRSIHKMMDQIQAQRERLGTSAMLCGIEERHCKAFLRMLYCKTKLRRKHLALLAEKRPLDQVRMGRASKLGEQRLSDLIIERLVKSLRKRAEKLQTVLTQYTKSQAAFVEAFPDRPAPPAPQYDELLQMPANNPFWNDGILSNHNEPWAVDQSTQAGMRDIARLARAEEEVRQIGREVRRSVRWAVHEHNRILTLMSGFLSTIEGDFDNAFGDTWQQVDQETMPPPETMDLDGNAMDSEDEFERALEEEYLNAAFADTLQLNV